MSVKARIWAGLALLLVGLVIGGAMFVAMFLRIDDDVAALHRFGAAAGGGALVVDEPLHVWLFLEPQERSLSGVRYALVDLATGDEVQLRGTSSGRQTYDMPTGSGRSLARADLDPGEYVVIVEPPAVTIAIGPSPLPGFGEIVRPVLLAGPLVVVGLALALISAIQQSRRRTQEATSSLPPPGTPPASGWATGTWETADPTSEPDR